MRHFRTYKLPSGALQLTVFIGVVIALLLAGLLLLAFTHRNFAYQSKAGIDVIKSCNDGIRYLKTERVVYFDTIYLPQPTEQKNRPVVKMLLSGWGLFRKASVVAVHRKKRFIKIALLGSALGEDRVALYLQETFKPLALAGATVINGDVTLPKMGVKPGYIAGNSFFGNELLHGYVGGSSQMLPVMESNYKKESNYYIQEYKPESYNQFISLQEKSLQLNSFAAPTKGFSSDKAIEIGDVKLQGNIIIRSAKAIKVTKEASLKDVILAAPVVEIVDGVKGTFQVFASQSIVCGKNCRLSYPSSLVLVAEPLITGLTFDRNRDKISIGENTIIKGCVVYLGSDEAKGYLPNIFLDPLATVAGEVFCNGNFELRGSVYGSVYTKQFVVNEGGTVYLNHLYNATIDAEKFSTHYVGLLFADKPKDVAKWLY